MHDHVGWVFNDSAAFRVDAARYLAGGLSAGHRVMYVSGDSGVGLPELAGLDAALAIGQTSISAVSSATVARRRTFFRMYGSSGRFHRLLSQPDTVRPFTLVGLVPRVRLPAGTSQTVFTGQTRRVLMAIVGGMTVSMRDALLLALVLLVSVAGVALSPSAGPPHQQSRTVAWYCPAPPVTC